MTIKSRLKKKSKLPRFAYKKDCDICGKPAMFSFVDGKDKKMKGRCKRHLRRR